MSPRAARAAAVAQAPRPLHVPLPWGPARLAGDSRRGEAPGSLGRVGAQMQGGSRGQPGRGVTAALAGGRFKAGCERRGFRTLNPLLNVKPEEP